MASEYGTPKKKLSKREAETLLKEVRDRLNEAWEHDKDNRHDAASDLKFLSGDQWPEAVRREREAAGRPMLTINRLPQFVRQITNDIRQAEIAIKVAPEDDDSDPALAKTFDGLIRQIQYQSSAKYVYAQSAEHQTACGIGWFRICTEYANDSAFDQEIRIKGIRNPLSVYDDPAAIEPDRSDSNWRIITEMMPRKSFKEQYPDAEETSVDVSLDSAQSTIFWGSQDLIRIAEYWRKVPVDKELALMPDGSTLDWGSVPKDLRPFLPAPVKTRIHKGHRIEQFVVSGGNILEGPNDWPGSYIPIVPVIGGEMPLEARTYRYSAIRFARDPQQLYNFYRTATAEAIALQPKAPYLVTMKMIGKVKGIWDQANKSPLPYLPYEVDPDAPSQRPQREAPPALPAALMQEAQVAGEDMKATTGIFDAALGARSNETAGVAIRARQIEADTANYHFVDNLQRSLEYAGRVLIDLIPKIYDNERVIRLMGENDAEEETVKINQVVMGMDGVPIVVNDLSAARFDVRVKIGKSYQTKRAEAADSLLAFVQAVPAAGQVAADLIAKNFDWPGADELAKRLRNTVPPQILADPEKPETQPPPDPVAEQMQALQAQGAMAEVAKLNAEVENKRADTMLKMLQGGMPPEVLMQMFPLEFADQQMPGEQMQPQPAEGEMMPDGMGMELDPEQLAALQGQGEALPPSQPF